MKYIYGELTQEITTRPTTYIFTTTKGVEFRKESWAALIIKELNIKGWVLIKTDRIADDFRHTFRKERE